MLTSIAEAKFALIITAILDGNIEITKIGDFESYDHCATSSKIHQIQLASKTNDHFRNISVFSYACVQLSGPIEAQYQESVTKFDQETMVEEDNRDSENSASLKDRLKTTYDEMIDSSVRNPDLIEDVINGKYNSTFESFGGSRNDFISYVRNKFNVMSFDKSFFERLRKHYFPDADTDGVGRYLGHKIDQEYGPID